MRANAIRLLSNSVRAAKCRERAKEQNSVEERAVCDVLLVVMIMIDPFVRTDRLCCLMCFP